MKIFIVCSKHFYHLIPPIEKTLKEMDCKITFPNSYEDPFAEYKAKEVSKEEHIKIKQEFMRMHEPKIKKNDAILVLNFNKKGILNYVGEEHLWRL